MMKSHFCFRQTHLSDIPAHREVDLEAGGLLVELSPHHVAVGALDDQVLQFSDIADVLLKK